MKKLLMATGVMLALLIGSIQSSAQENVIWGCYQKEHGQLRIVTGPDDCLDSERPISWNKACPHDAFPSILYVNGTTGQDLPGWGVAPDKPFKTITHALEGVFKEATIYVASGTYNETLVVDKLINLKLEGVGADKTIIKGHENGYAINLVGPNRVEVKGFSIQGGMGGIWCTGSSLYCNNNTIENNGYGISVGGSAEGFINDCTIQHNSLSGITIGLNCSAWIGNCNIAENGQYGILVSQSSSAEIGDSLISNNDWGVGVNSGGSIGLFRNQIDFNRNSGVNAGYGGIAVLRGSNTISHNADFSGGTAGIRANQGSQLVLQHTVAGPDVIRQNNGPGILVEHNSTLSIWHGIVSDNKGDGVMLGVDSNACLYGDEDNIVITDNDGYGVNCRDAGGDSKCCFQSPDLSGNALGETNCETF